MSLNSEILFNINKKSIFLFWRFLKKKFWANGINLSKNYWIKESYFFIIKKYKMVLKKYFREEFAILSSLRKRHWHWSMFMFKIGKFMDSTGENVENLANQ